MFQRTGTRTSVRKAGMPERICAVSGFPKEFCGAEMFCAGVRRVERVSVSSWYAPQRQPLFRAAGL